MSSNRVTHRHQTEGRSSKVPCNHDDAELDGFSQTVETPEKMRSAHANWPTPKWSKFDEDEIVNGLASAARCPQGCGQIAPFVEKQINKQSDRRDGTAPDIAVTSICRFLQVFLMKNTGIANMIIARQNVQRFPERHMRQHPADTLARPIPLLPDDDVGNRLSPFRRSSNHCIPEMRCAAAIINSPDTSVLRLENPHRFTDRPLIDDP